MTSSIKLYSLALQQPLSRYRLLGRNGKQVLQKLLNHMPNSQLVNLMPGEYYFGDEAETIKTLLGSCVAITLWHPLKKLAGMCHIVLPGGNYDGPECNARYASCAMGRFLHDIKQSGTRPCEFEVGIFGGGRMFSHRTDAPEQHVGAKNVAESYRLAIDAGFQIRNQDVLENKYRHVFLNGQTGALDVQGIEVENTMD